MNFMQIPYIEIFLNLAILKNGLMLKIEELLALYPQNITFKDDGGIRLLQFKESFSKTKILKSYYDAQSFAVC